MSTLPIYYWIIRILCITYNFSSLCFKILTIIQLLWLLYFLNWSYLKVSRIIIVLICIGIVRINIWKWIYFDICRFKISLQCWHHFHICLLNCLNRILTAFNCHFFSFSKFNQLFRWKVVWIILENIILVHRLILIIFIALFNYLKVFSIFVAIAIGKWLHLLLICLLSKCVILVLCCESWFWLLAIYDEN